MCKQLIKIFDNTSYSLSTADTGSDYAISFIKTFHIIDKLDGQQTETEAIDPFPVSPEKALEMIDSREICDAKTIAGIFWYLRWKEKHP